MTDKTNEKPVKKNKDGFEPGQQLSHADLMKMRDKKSKKAAKAS